MILDILIIIFTALTFYIGYNNGIMGVALKVVLFFGCIFLALKLFPIVFLFIENTFSEPSELYFAVGFLLVLVGLIFLFKLLSTRINRLKSKSSMKLFTKISGGLILSMFLFTLICVIIGRLNKLRITQEAQYESSLLYPGLKKVDQGLSYALHQMQESFNNSFERNIKTINKRDRKQKKDSL